MSQHLVIMLRDLQNLYTISISVKTTGEDHIAVLQTIKCLLLNFSIKCLELELSNRQMTVLVCLCKSSIIYEVAVVKNLMFPQEKHVTFLIHTQAV